MSVDQGAVRMRLARMLLCAMSVRMRPTCIDAGHSIDVASQIDLAASQSFLS